VFLGFLVLWVFDGEWEFVEGEVVFLLVGEDGFY